MLKEICEQDLDRLEELEKICFLKSPWSKQMLLESISFANVFKKCIQKDGKIVAYIIAGFSNWEAEIFTIGVDVEYRRQGLAKELLLALKQFCQETQKESLFLEVRKSNLSAQKLYSGFGFKQVAVRRKYYENTEDAIIMEYKISES